VSNLSQQLSAVFSRLSRREQRMLSALVLVFTLVALYLLLVSPILRGHARLQRGIDNLQTDIATMQKLQEQIRTLQVSLGDRPGQVTDQEGFSLFSFIDRVTAASVDSENIDSMNPSRRELKSGLDEMVVDLRLSRVSLSAVVSLLRSIEESGRPIYTKQLELKRRYDDRTHFDVTLMAATLVRS